jgi:hypothetical protein
MHFVPGQNAINFRVRGHSHVAMIQRLLLACGAVLAFSCSAASSNPGGSANSAGSAGVAQGGQGTSASGGALQSSGGSGNATASGGSLTSTAGDGTGGGSLGGASTAGAASGGASASGGSAAIGGGGAGGSTGCGVPTSFKWTSSGPLISPRTGAVSIKDPSVVFFENKWQIFATDYSTSYNMVYLNFTDWNAADSATKTLASTNANLSGYKAAPTMFYFAPQQLWYLVYQTQTPAYSTTATPSVVSSWTAKKNFWTADPSIITNSGTGGIDYWPICDDTNCYIFYSADNGELYRAQTTKANFPNGFGNQTKILGSTSNMNALFEASNVYKMKGTNKYLLIVEAIGNGRYFRSFTADALDGAWTALADTEAKPFAGKSNVTGADWSNDGISHGEMLRDGYDETMVIDTCNMRYLFQGRTAVGSIYDLNKYSLGLLTAAP